MHAGFAGLGLAAYCKKAGWRARPREFAAL